MEEFKTIGFIAIIIVVLLGPEFAILCTKRYQNKAWHPFLGLICTVIWTITGVALTYAIAILLEEVAIAVALGSMMFIAIFFLYYHFGQLILRNRKVDSDLAHQD